MSIATIGHIELYFFETPDVFNREVLDFLASVHS